MPLNGTSSGARGGRIPRTCVHCGGDFLAWRSEVERNRADYCSRPCYWEGRRVRPVLVRRENCERCGTALTSDQRRYCSYRCYWDGILPNMPLADRFWLRVEKSDGCWIWTGTRDKGGYGRLMRQREDGRHSPRLAHRVSWEIHYGPIPPRMVILHTCDNPPCVRPDHLRIGTQRENMADAAQKRRTTSGERGSGSKLTDEQVLEIRQRFAEHDVTMTSLGREYGIGARAIGQIVNGETWRHLLP